ncbi:glycosyltransferase family 2 protein [Alteromonas stellipolaris]|uniref:glycosyltransferase n=1 Tax=Alteromonas stellipolaris TaxID=233316 RepID=UPI002119A812|nr:glycosyltransferase family A protein [Alteromonas stellipolaris]MCQ8847334.1 glycosyltransferase family 2 protein [Alteromonas stellipolaris]
MNNNIGIVAIGRNEGERFQKCLSSFKSLSIDFTFVYVDSGSTDNSVQNAIDAGYAVVELDTSIPFTAARARNAGVNYLKQHVSKLSFIQFVDGDCQVDASWIDLALKTLNDEPDLAAVCGRRSEINPNASVYNKLIDIEWDTPVGYAKACGGDALYRATPFLEVNGFNESIIAGEEPELCYRLRHHGWKIKRIDAAMTYHDAALYLFSAWWKRAERYGHAAFEGAWRYGKTDERYEVAQVRGIILWGCAFPVLLALSLLIGLLPFFVVLGLGLTQLLKLALRFNSSSSGENRVNPTFRAGLTMLCKIAEFKGGCLYLKNKLVGKKNELIEYK